MVYIAIGASVFTVFMMVRGMLRENEREEHALESFNKQVEKE
tara:strand:+ start:104 stop:229 length:126 start_codon:yes stop_codon:yes gene_type:complete